MTRNNEWGSRKAPGLSVVADASERWKTMPDGPEKYAAYLCSREWAAIKTKVRERSGGKCERCCDGSAENCHHLTYIRKFCERLSDLQDVCRPCHEFLSGKTDLDPKEKWRHPKPLLESIGPNASWDFRCDVMLCPVCHFDYCHFDAPKIGHHVFGDAIVVTAWCENGHEWELVIGHHKGNTYLFTQDHRNREAEDFDHA